MLANHSEALTAASVTVTLGVATPGQLLGLNTERNGAQISVDTAATQTVYVLFGTGTPSSTNFHVAVAPGGSASIAIDGVVWGGAVQAVSGAAAKVGVLET